MATELVQKASSPEELGGLSLVVNQKKVELFFWPAFSLGLFVCIAFLLFVAKESLWLRGFLFLFFGCVVGVFVYYPILHGRFVFGANRDGFVFKVRNRFDSNVYYKVPWGKIKKITVEMNGVVDDVGALKSGFFVYSGSVIEVRTTIPHEEFMGLKPCHGGLCVSQGNCVLCFNPGKRWSYSKIMSQLRLLSNNRI